MRHKSVQKLFYEYLRKELDPVQRKKVEGHLASCRRCTEELADLRSVLDSIHPHSLNAAGERSEEFWNSFPSSVEVRLHHERRQTGQAEKPTSLQAFFPVLSSHPRLVPALGSILAIAAIAVLAWQLRSPVKPEAEQSSILQPLIESAPDGLAEYFRRSKVLLVGLTNLKTPESEPIDLSTERRRSEQLLQAARRIPRDSLDSYSAMVVDDLERVLAEIAVAKGANEHRHVEALREAIRRQNLIFKLRMIEKMHTSPAIVWTRDEIR